MPVFFSLLVCKTIHTTYSRSWGVVPPSTCTTSLMSLGESGRADRLGVLTAGQWKGSPETCNPWVLSEFWSQLQVTVPRTAVFGISAKNTFSPVEGATWFSGRFVCVMVNARQVYLYSTFSTFEQQGNKGPGCFHFQTCSLWFQQKHSIFCSFLLNPKKLKLNRFFIYAVVYSPTTTMDHVTPPVLVHVISNLGCRAVSDAQRETTEGRAVEQPWSPWTV